MNPRRRRKVDIMLASSEARACHLAPGLFARTGSLAAAAGFFKPRLYIDPRLLGEHRTLQEFVRMHEGAHLALGHTRLLALFKWSGIVMAAGLGAIFGAIVGASVASCVEHGLVFAWLEAYAGASTLWVRARCELEADGLALTAMRPNHFAAAVKTLDQVKGPRTGWRGFEDRVLNGAGHRERLERVGVHLPADKPPVGQVPAGARA